MAAKPIVDGIEQEHGSKLRVIRLNIQDRAGEQLAARFGLQFTPTFVLLNAQGEVIGRWAGALDPG
ncbi:MAG TPA: thioredoxin family protein, partial [Anaerolineales bacterium]|nr:thioredoxin family protein [Anaerolineales bacterium]